MSSPVQKLTIQTNDAPQAIGPYSQAVRVGNQLWLSGQIGMTAGGELVTGGVEAETKQIMENIGAVLRAAGGSYDSVVKCTVLFADLGDFAAVNAIYAQYFGESKPARAAFQVAALPRGARLEVEAIAML